MRLLLDTATLIYAVVAPERLSKRAAGLLKNPRHVLEVSSISLAEIAIKANLGKLEISEADARQAILDLDARILAYTSDHALSLFGLPSHHRDPFDRQIIAQALFEEIPILTPDDMFSLYRGLKVIW